MNSKRAAPGARSDYPRFQTIGTRWMDNDVYGHVNNVVHYSFFDTAVNRWLIEQGALDIHGGAVIGLVVETGCSYFEPIAFPQTVHAGLRVAHLGRSSVRYEVGLFADEAERAAKLARLKAEIQKGIDDIEAGRYTVYDDPKEFFDDIEKRARPK